MKFLLTAINAKYIHSNPGVYSLKMFAESQGAAEAVQGDQDPREDGLPCAPFVEIAEYTINNQMELILEDIYRRKPDMVGISCYIWNIAYVLDLVRDIHKVLPETDIWLGGPEVSYDAPQLLVREPEVFGVMKGEGEEMFAALLKVLPDIGMHGAGNRCSAEGGRSGLRPRQVRHAVRMPQQKRRMKHALRNSGTACLRWQA